MSTIGWTFLGIDERMDTTTVDIPLGMEDECGLRLH